MEFGWSEEEAQYRAELRNVIAEHLSPGWSLTERALYNPELREACVKFCRALGASGMLTPHWPEEYGGRNSSPWERLVVSEELWGAGEPRGPQYMNLNWIGPAIMRAGTEEQRRTHLRPISAGDVIWCQGFSEPNAGSDLASLETRAVRDGDTYVVNGQKIWTSFAHVADYCFLLVRTDVAAEKHAGISILLTPMDLHGIEVREIPTPYAEHLVHEVFFRDVRVPVACRLGDENHGWSIVQHALAEERTGVPRYAYTERLLDSALAEAEASGRSVSEDPGLVERVGSAFALFEAARSLMYVAVQEGITSATAVRPMASVWRVVGAGMAEIAAREVLSDVMGVDGLENGSLADQYAAIGTYAPIVAGSYELQLNLIARHALGLPKG